MNYEISSLLEKCELTLKGTLPPNSPRNENYQIKQETRKITPTH